jgi:hypothetical protein
VAKYVVSSANWKKKFEVEDQSSYEDTLFELATRAVEWALNNGKEVGLLVQIDDQNFPDSSFSILGYKVLNNAGFYNLAEEQRKLVKEDYKIDLAEDAPLSKLIIKLQKASLRKAFCIAKLVPVEADDRVSKIPIVCINLGLYENEIDAKEKCKELNASLKEKLFTVRKITYNM